MDLGLIKNFTSAGAIPKFRLVAATATDGIVAQAATATDKIIGTTGPAGVDGADKRIDVCLDGIRDVEFGDDVVFGDPLTSDAEGRAIPAAPAAGSNVRIVGTAMENGGVGVIGKVHVVPSTLQG